MGSFNTTLKDRVLWFDGDSVVKPEDVLGLIDRGLGRVYVTEETDEIKQYNRLAPKDKAITTKWGIQPLTYNWNIPEKYKTLDVVEYVIDKWAVECVNNEITSDEADIRALRVSEELSLYKKLDLIPILRVIIYVINTLQNKNIVWGVGRGSSVSSYVLYLIGVHDVDSVQYDLDINDFLRLPDTN